MQKVESALRAEETLRLREAHLPLSPERARSLTYDATGSIELADQVYVQFLLNSMPEPA